MRTRLLSLAFVMLMLSFCTGTALNGQEETKAGSQPGKKITPIRRIVTGTNAEGKSTVIFDGPNPNVIQRPRGAGGGFDLFWFTDSLPADNSGNADSTIGRKTNAAPPNGSSFHVIEWEPGEGLSDEGEPASVGGREPGMHHTKTIDYVMVLSGAINMRLEDGSEVQIKAGDALVQRGTYHKWVNRGSVPCRAVIVQIASIPTKD